MKRLALIILAVTGMTASACGGSSPSTTTTRTSAAQAERTRLESQLRASLEAPTSPTADVQDLDSCIVEQAGRLPLANLRTLAGSSVSVSVTDPLLARCVAQGKGLSFVRGAIADVVAGKLPPPVPAAFSNCVVAGVNRLTTAQLAAAFNSDATGSQASSRRIGQQLSLACIEKPAVFAQWRRLWIAGVKHVLAGQHLPAAYANCIVAKAAQIRPLELVKLGQSGSKAEKAYGHNLGRECQAAVGG